MVYFKAGRTDSVRIINFDFLIDKSINDVPIIMIIAYHLTMHADRYDILSHKDLADIFQHQKKTARFTPITVALINLVTPIPLNNQSGKPLVENKAQD